MSNMVEGNASVAAMAEAAGVMEAVVAAIRAHPDNEDLQDGARSALSSMGVDVTKALAGR